MDSETQINTDEGNTKTSSVRSRAWFLTFNNPPDRHTFQELLDFVGVQKYVFQLEQGDIENTPHFQGVIYFENARTFDQVKQISRKIHWERCKDIRKAIKYCIKPEGRIDGPWAKGFKLPPIIRLIDPSTREWQDKLVKEVSQECTDDRKIIWYYDQNGGSGKTSLAKYFAAKHNALVVQGKASDIKYAVSKWIEKYGKLDLVIFIFPRSVEQYISYDAIESVKDGILFNSKYESGMCVFNTPHVICFANFEPNKQSLTLDRWDIRKL